MNNIQYPAPRQEYKVLVRCATYNQSKYIEDALTGFAIQQTNFPFVCLVMDDASTDGEQDVIRKWIERECDMSRSETIDIPTSIVILVPHKTNPSCTFAFYMLKQNLYKAQEEKKKHISPWRDKCVYEALCEGDDYWIDPLKLQKQVDIMDGDEGIALCYTRAKKFIQISNMFESEPIGTEFMGFKEMLFSNPVCTLTTIYKTSLFNQYLRDINPNSMNWKMGDYPFWLWIAAHYKVHYMNDVTSVYRVLLNSASHSDKKENILHFILSKCNIQLFFSQKYLPECSAYIENRKHFYESLLLAYNNKYIESIKLFLRVKDKSLFDCARFIKYLICI